MNCQLAKIVVMIAPKIAWFESGRNEIRYAFVAKFLLASGAFYAVLIAESNLQSRISGTAIVLLLN
ncbi:hypothetical protein MON38_02860 [Hymenobacter sp. DH14]|uniref:Uncharacterized protein n=1 Tax=Hymenobacter cyanobacteriorum TaxID=2926463 RepID=A0A9X1VD40_9BACT|nr:hypothetical protein [Hymenobacter cyanobacteriorum]MCI1186345.1 hypothetical protein [Hymenobacter cyanobacteriorum]